PIQHYYTHTHPRWSAGNRRNPAVCYRPLQPPCKDHPMRLLIAAGALFLAASILPAAEPPKNAALTDRVAAVDEKAGPEVSALVDLYKDFHVHPELSLHEERSSARLAKEARALGFDVTEKVGGTGVVAV